MRKAHKLTPWQRFGFSIKGLSQKLGLGYQEGISNAQASSLHLQLVTASAWGWPASSSNAPTRATGRAQHMDAHPNSLCLLCWSVVPTGTGSWLTHPVSHVWELPEELHLAQSRDSPLESVTASVRYLPASVDAVSHSGFCLLVLTKPSHPGGQHTAGTSHQTHLGVRPVHFSGQCWGEFSGDWAWVRAGLQKWVEEAGLQHEESAWRGFNAESRSVSQLLSSFPCPVHRVERLGRRWTTSLHRRAAKAGVLKEVTNAPCYLNPVPQKIHIHTGSKPPKPTKIHRQAWQGEGRVSWRPQGTSSSNDCCFCWRDRNWRYGQAPSTESCWV